MVIDLAVCSGSAARSPTGKMHKRAMASSKRRQFMARECTRFGRKVARRRATHRPHSVIILKLLSAAGCSSNGGRTVCGSRPTQTVDWPRASHTMVAVLHTSPRTTPGSMLPKTKLCSFALLLLCSAPAWSGQRISFAGSLPQAQAGASGQLHVTVMDQNGEPLPFAVVILQQNDKTLFQERTTPSGNAVLRQLAPGAYKVLIEKQGFYTATVANIAIVAGQTLPVEVRLQPVREYREEIEVTAQPSPIDPEQSSNSQSITASEVSNIPYPDTRDYRNVLPFIPGVVADSSGQIHVAGSSTQEIQDYLDGFEVGQPAGGALAVQLNPDSLLKIDVRSSRYSAQFGKGSGGIPAAPNVNFPQ